MRAAHAVAGDLGVGDLRKKPPRACTLTSAYDICLDSASRSEPPPSASPSAIAAPSAPGQERQLSEVGEGELIPSSRNDPTTQGYPIEGDAVD
eukprot:669359-Prymnesium_polylepis.1